MRALFLLLLASLLTACTLPPLPPDNPKMAWVDLYTRTGRLVMAERLDGKRLDDGRYFQLTPGAHELVVRFDYEVSYGVHWNDPVDRTCYLYLKYNDFKAGQRYRLEGWILGIEPDARLHEGDGEAIIATAYRQFCPF